MGIMDIAEEQHEQEQQKQSSYGAILGTIKDGSIETGRNVSLTKVAGLLRSKGLDFNIIFELLKNINIAQNFNLQEQEIKKISLSVSRYSPQLENRQPESNDIITVERAAYNWMEQRKTISVCKTGYDKIDYAIPYFEVGEIFTIAGRSGTLKTTIGIELTRRISNSMQSSGLFASLEMDNRSVFFRMANSEYSRISNAECDSYMTAEKLKDAVFIKKVISRNKNIYIVDKDSLTIEQIEAYVNLLRETVKTDLLLIDYLGYMQDTQPGSNYDKVSRVAKGIKALAKRLQIRIILLCQTSRSGEDGTVPVQLHHLRDSGAIEESADYILGLWHSIEEKNRLHAEILKNRNGPRGVKVDLINQGLHIKQAEDILEENKKVKTGSF